MRTALAGETTFKEVSKGKLREFKVRLPSDLDEQRRIVARIRELMSRLAEAQRLRSGSSREIQYVEGALFADLVQENAAKADCRVEPLKAVLLDTDYGTSAKANTAGRGVSILRMGNIRDGHLDVESVKHIELSSSDLAKYTLHHGDILINRTNSLEQVGKAAVFNREDGPWVFASYLIRLLVDRRQALPEYVSAVINSRIGRSYVRRTARRAIGMVNINVKEIEAMPMPLPAIEVQEAVVARIAEARKTIQQIRANLPAFNEQQLRSAILRRAFSGEL